MCNRKGAVLNNRTGSGSGIWHGESKSAAEHQNHCCAINTVPITIIILVVSRPQFFNCFFFPPQLTPAVLLIEQTQSLHIGDSAGLFEPSCLHMFELGKSRATPLRLITDGNAAFALSTNLQLEYQGTAKHVQFTI